MDTLFSDLLLAHAGDLDALFLYLVELLGSSGAAEQAVITEDIVLN